MRVITHLSAGAALTPDFRPLALDQDRKRGTRYGVQPLHQHQECSVPNFDMRSLANIFAAAAAYFGIVFAVAFGLGTVRTFFVEPSFGQPGATIIEAPFLLAAMLWAASWIPRRFHLIGNQVALASVGLTALALQQVADAALGLTLRRLTLVEQYAQFLRPEGWVFAILLVVFAGAPYLLHHSPAKTQ